MLYFSLYPMVFSDTREGNQETTKENTTITIKTLKIVY